MSSTNSNTPRFHGVFPILHTPFTADGEIDDASFVRQAEYCLDAGAGGVVFPSLASEFFTLTHEERKHLTKLLVDTVSRRVPVVIGVTTSIARTSVDLAAFAAKAGADGLLAMPPFPIQGTSGYGKEYFSRIAAAAPELPIILQNPRQPEGIPIAGEEMAALLAAVPTLRYVKEEALPPGSRVTAMLEEFGERIDGVFAGFFGLSYLQDAARGAIGVMPGVPLVRTQVEIQRAIDSGDWDRAFRLQKEIQSILHYLSLYSLTGEKELMRRLGLFDTTVTRAPHATLLTDTHLRELEQLLEHSQIYEVLA